MLQIWTPMPIGAVCIVASIYWRSEGISFLNSSADLERLTANAVVATVLSSTPASSDTVVSEGRQMKQCWVSYIKKEKNPKKPPFRFLVDEQFAAFCLFVRTLPIDFALLGRKWKYIKSKTTAKLKGKRTSIAAVRDQFLSFSTFPTPLLSRYRLPLNI